VNGYEKAPRFKPTPAKVSGVVELSPYFRVLSTFLFRCRFGKFVQQIPKGPFSNVIIRVYKDVEMQKGPCSVTP